MNDLDGPARGPTCLPISNLVRKNWAMYHEPLVRVYSDLIVLVSIFLIGLDPAQTNRPSFMDFLVVRADQRLGKVGLKLVESHLLYFLGLLCQDPTFAPQI